MFDRLMTLWDNYKRHRRQAREIDPKAFHELSTELIGLADAASKLWHQEPEFQERVKRIRTEMAELEKLTSKPEFKRLSPQKRLELRRSLIQSKAQLLESMHAAPSPTSTLQ